MSVIISKQADIEDYFAADEVNQSTLKDLIGGLDSYMAAVAKRKKDKEEDKPIPDYFLIGGAVDTILTGEEGEFEKQYYVSTLVKKPSEVEMSIVESVFYELAGALEADVLQTISFEDNPDAILAAANTAGPEGKGWQMNWKAETRVVKLIAAGTEYFEDLKRAYGKKILSSEMRKKIDLIVNSLKTNRKTSKYFDRDLQNNIENIDFYYQLPIYFSHEGVECKALMDLVVVHKDKAGKIAKIEPIDLKTMSGGTLQFLGNMRKHRYDIQAAWYTKALSKHFNFPEGNIEPFKFIVESTTSIGKPLVFEITPGTLLHGQEGVKEGTFLSNDGKRSLFYPEVKGYKQLLEEYAYYAETGFIEDKVVEGTDILTLDWIKGIVGC